MYLSDPGSRRADFTEQERRTYENRGRRSHGGFGSSYRAIVIAQVFGNEARILAS